MCIFAITKTLKMENMNKFILKTEDDFYLCKDENFGFNRLVSDIEKSTAFNYDGAVKESNLLIQVSDIKTNIIKHKL